MSPNPLFQEFDAGFVFLGLMLIGILVWAIWVRPE